MAHSFIALAGKQGRAVRPSTKEKTRREAGPGTSLSGGLPNPSGKAPAREGAGASRFGVSAGMTITADGYTLAGRACAGLPTPTKSPGAPRRRALLQMSARRGGLS